MGPPCCPGVLGIDATGHAARRRTVHPVPPNLQLPGVAGPAEQQTRYFQLMKQGWNNNDACRHHPRDRVGVLGMSEGGEAVERVDRPESCVAGPGAVAAFLFEVGEERADQRRVEIVDVQLERWLAGLSLREGEQQSAGVAVGGNRLWPGIALGDQPVGEKCLQRRREQGHASVSGSCSRRRLITSSSSGTASRYQYVLAGST